VWVIHILIGEPISATSEQNKAVFGVAGDFAKSAGAIAVL
jgi:hypothetical protein